MSTFSEAVHQQFGPLASSYGLTCISSGDRLVRFEGERVFFVVHYDSSESFEMGIHFGQVSEANISYELGEILGLKGSPEAVYVSQLQVSKAASIGELLKNLAILTKAYASGFISGDASAFEEIRRFHRKSVEDYDLQRRLRYGRELGNAAWKEEDYVGVINAYGSIKENLTASELMRLSIARRRLV